MVGKRIRPTEIVESILSASDVGGVPPPMSGMVEVLYPGGWAQLLRGDRSLIVPRIPLVRRPALGRISVITRPNSRWGKGKVWMACVQRENNEVNKRCLLVIRPNVPEH